MIDFTGVKAITIPEGVVKQITRKSDGVVLWKAGYKNWVKYSTTNDGKTIYNGGKGYKDGYRLRSGGAEQSTSGASHTGFIPVKGGDVVRISGCNFEDGSANRSALNVSNASFTNIGQFSMIPSNYGIFGSTYKAYGYESVVKETAGVWKWIVPPDASGVAYIRVTGNVASLSPQSGSNLIVTINEEII